MCTCYRVTDVLKVTREPRSSYYNRLSRGKSRREQEDEVYIQYIKELQAKHTGRYGVVRMKNTLKQDYAVNINHKRVYRLMKSSNNLSSVKVKRKRYSKGQQGVFVNLLQGKDFKTQEPYEKFVTDVTEFKEGKRKLYLSAVKDLHTHMIEGYVLSHHQSERLALTTVDLIKDKSLEQGTIFHSDQGRIYGSHRVREVLEENNFRQSMSKSGTPTDNAPMESFFGTLKSETIYNERCKCDNVAEVVKDFIFYYNNHRIQKSLGYKTPAQFKRQELERKIINNTTHY